MRKSIYSRQQEVLCGTLVSLRKTAGLNQRQLAKALRRDHSLIAKLELGQRRIDLIEFHAVCLACGADPAKESAKLMESFTELVQADT